MCLHKLSNKKDFLETIENTIKVYRLIRKVLIREDDTSSSKVEFRPIFSSQKLKKGVNNAIISETILENTANEYQAGFHSFLTREDAKTFQNSMQAKRDSQIIECTVEKKWITAFGKQALLYEPEENPITVDCVVSDKILIEKLSY